MKLPINQKGFAPIIWIIFIVTFLTLFGGIFYFRKNQNKPTVTPPSPITPFPSPTKNKLEKELNKTKQDLEALKNKQASSEAELKSQNEALIKKTNCLELVKQTPDIGDGELIGVNIVKFYQGAVAKLEQVKINPSRPNDPEDSKAEVAFWTKVVTLAKPMYDKYIAECSN